MGKPMLKSGAARCFRAALVLLLAACSPPLLPSSGAEAPRSLGALSYPYSSILSPLLRALSEHGGARWSSGLKKNMKPEHRYMSYLSRVYKKSSRVQRSLEGGEVYNTIRLIKPQEECVTRGTTEHVTQDLSYSLDQVRSKELLLRSALLYSFERAERAPDSVCYLSIKELKQSALCAGISRTLNLTAGTHQRRRRNWVEVDVTVFLQPLLQKNINFLINISCPHEQSLGINGSTGLRAVTLRAPPLVLYLNDTSKVAHQRSQANTSTGERSSSATNALQKQLVSKPNVRLAQKRRWRRASSKSKRGDKSMDMQLPELKSSSEFPTSDCALYDFRVRFSQLKLDHWIVFPPKYNPRYCRGICPRTMGFIYGSPVHTMVQNIIYEKLDSSVPRPSCVPSHYSPLSVMIFEEDGSYAYKEFKDMVATRCTCR